MWNGRTRSGWLWRWTKAGESTWQMWRTPEWICASSAYKLIDYALLTYGK